MTTNEADRIKGLVEGLKLHAWSDAASEVPVKEHVAWEAAEALQALQTRAEDAARRGHAGGYPCTPEHTWKEWANECWRDAQRAEFLLALIAAAAPGPITDEWVSEAVEKSCRGEAVAPAELAAAYAYELGWRDGNREAASFIASLTPPLEQGK